jgi:hypothetical protein
MTGKKDKDIWGKISNAASTAGKAITDEYRRLKLSHEIWNLKRDLEKTQAEVGEIVHKRYCDMGKQTDEEFASLCSEIDGILSAIAELKRQREKITEAAERAEKATEPAGEDDGDGAPEADETELEFLDDAEMEFSCPECGCKIRLDDETFPNYCLKCGHKLPTE